MVGVDIFELDDAICIDHKDGGHGQQMVRLTGRLLQTLVHLLAAVYRVPSNAKRLRRGQVMVVQQREGDAEVARILLRYIGLVRAGGEKLVAQFLDLRQNFLQLNQLLAAVASPVAAEKGQDGRLIAHGGA